MHPRQVPCWITHTNARTHDIIRAGLDRSPMYHRRDQERRAALLPVDRGQGRALRRPRRATRSSSSPKASTRTRSIPTASRRRCRSTCSSTLVRSMPGCENAHILRPGYAIEYDYFDPRGLEVHARDQGDRGPVLRRARSTGRRATRKPPRRACSPAINAGASRARRRRLVPAPRRGVSRRARRRPHHARRVRAVPDVHVARGVPAATARGQRGPAADRTRPPAGAWSMTPAGMRSARKRDADRRRARTPRTTLRQSASRRPRTMRNACWDKPIEREYALTDLLRRPDVTYASLHHAAGCRHARRRIRRSRSKSRSRPSTRATSTASTTRSRGNLALESSAASRRISTTAPVRGLSAEVQQKLNLHKPETIGQAARISGITPAAISLAARASEAGGARRAGRRAEAIRSSA